MHPEELKHIAVLQAMDNDALARLATALEERDYADGQSVFAEGDPGDSMYFIAKGCVRIEKRAQANSTADKLLTVLEAGDYFGEMALLDQKPRSASALSSGDTRILRLSKSAFDQMRSQSGVAAISVLFAMIRTSSERIRRLSSQLVVYDQVGKAIGESQDLQSLLDVILQQLSSATEADCGMLLLRSQFSDQLEPRSLLGMALTAAQREAVMNGQGFLAQFLQNPQDQIIANFGAQEAFNTPPRLGFETPSLLLSPISVEAQLLGLIVLGGKGCDHFDLNALHLVRGVARQAAQAILNARHREEQIARSQHSRQYVRF